MRTDGQLRKRAGIGYIPRSVSDHRGRFCRLCFNRVAGCDRHYCSPGEFALDSANQCQAQSAQRRLPEQPQAVADLVSPVSGDEFKLEQWALCQFNPVRDGHVWPA